MRAKDLLKEIDYTPGMSAISKRQLANLVNTSKVVGDIDNRDVLLYKENNTEYFFICGEVDQAVIGVTDYKFLTGIQNLSKTPGLVTALVGFVCHRLKRKVIIAKNEPLTPEGMRWLSQLIAANGRGLTIKDQDGNFPSSEKLTAEWNHIMKHDEHTDTEITIEGVLNKVALKSRGELLSEGRLMIPQWFVGYVGTL